MFYFLVEWLYFVAAHLGRIVCDLLSIVLSPIILFWDKKSRGFNRKSFKCILITGASSGIGASTAVLFAKPGVTLILTGRNKVRLMSIRNKCIDKGATVIAKRIDVTDADAMKSFIYECDDSQPLDLVIANAGIAIITIGEGYYPIAAKAMVDTNINGVLNTILPAIARMQDRKRGHIAMMGSLGGYWPNCKSGIYNATKIAVRYLAEDLRPQLRFWNIDCSYVMPGFVESRQCPARHCSQNIGFMDSNSGARFIVDGLETNQFSINFPLKTFTLAWLLGSLHPIIQPRLNERLCSRDYAFMNIGRRFVVDPNDEFGGEC